MSTYLWIGLGGFLGANARYIVVTWVTAQLGMTFPYGTMAVNLSGSFVLCFLVSFYSEQGAMPLPFRLAFLVGFLGSYTTFSTFSNEWLQLVQRGDMLRSFGYLLGSVLGGGLAGGAGLIVGRLVSSRHLLAGIFL